MSRRGWVVWVAVGVVVVAVGGVMLWVGLDAADKVGSVVGALCGVVGLGLSGYGLVQARRGRPEERSVTNSITGSSVLAPVVQAGSIERAAVVGDRNVVGDGTVVAGPGGVAVGPGGSVVLAAAAEPAEPLPPPKVDLCVGRDRQVAKVVAGWVGGRVVAVVGGPGIGKSTVLGRAIGDDTVIALFGLRRFVVSCEGAETAGAVMDKMAHVLGVALGDHLRNRVLSFLRGGPCVLVLDNFETVADGDPVGAAELVAQLRSGPDQVQPAVAGGFTLDDFTVDEPAGTVTCPAGWTRSTASSGPTSNGPSPKSPATAGGESSCATAAPSRTTPGSSVAPRDSTWAT